MDTRSAEVSQHGDASLGGQSVDGRRRGAHRPFFRAGISVLLTAGAVWGALLLLRISIDGSFTAISVHDINAHGHAQIFGWVGLFVMGFAYEMFVQWRTAGRALRRTVTITLVLMICGIVFRVVGEPLHEIRGMRALALVGAAFEILAIGAFAFVILRALRVPGKVVPAERPYVAAGVILFVVQAVFEGALLFATTGARSPDELLRVVSTWQAPLRDLQIHGFALLMILGVSLWLFPRTFGFRRPGSTWISFGWGAILLAVLAESVALIMMRITGQHGWGAMVFGAILLLAVTSISLVRYWLPGAGPAKQDHGVTFIRASSTWLAISMGMLVLTPVYVFVVLPAASGLSPGGARAAEIGFSHAYYGAIRHAITVGFISLTIMGVSSRIVPMLEGIAPGSMPPPWPSFVLVNVGCAMRVTLQTMTDFFEPAFLLVGASGVLEVAGLAFWGAHIWRVMDTPPRRGPGEGRDPDRSRDVDRLGQGLNPGGHRTEVRLS